MSDYKERQQKRKVQILTDLLALMRKHNMTVECRDSDGIDIDCEPSPRGAPYASVENVPWVSLELSRFIDVEEIKKALEALLKREGEDGQ